MKVTIIGCGNAGLIHAAKIYQKGNNEVCLLKTSNIHNTYFDRIFTEQEYDVLDLTDNANRFTVKPTLITRDPKVAMDFAEIVFVMTTTLQHESIAMLIGPHAHDGQLIVLCPGYMGSLIMKRHISADVIFSEWETTAYNGRIVNDEYVKITFYNPRNAISTLPASKGEFALSLLAPLFDDTRYLRTNILESAIHNPNMIVHTIGMTMSAARIEHSKGEFWMYKEAFTESIIRVIEKFDHEKNAILQAYGCPPLNYFEAAKWRNEESLEIDAMQSFRNFAEQSNKGPMQLRHRYLMEDVPNGLGLFISLGKASGLPTTIAESIMTLASALLGEDFEIQSRTVSRLLEKKAPSITDILNAIN